MDIAEVGLKADAKQIDKATDSLDRFNKEAKETESTTDKLNKENDKSAARFKSLAGTIGKVTVGLVGVTAALAGVGKGVSVIKEFEVAMSTVAAISRATEEELARMEATARQLGATTQFSATQAAEGMKFLAQAGFTAEEAISAIPNVLDLAKASALDLGTAADIASNVMSGFGIAATDAANASDILAALSSRANTNVQQLGDAAAYVGPVAAAMGISLGDASAAIGVLSDAGIQGSMAGTSLRRVLSALANTTPDAEAALKNMGLTLSEVDPAANDLTDVIQRLGEAGLSAKDALTIFGDRGGPAILALTANAPRMAELAEEMKKVDGESKRMAETMGDNLSGDVDRLTSAMSELALAIGDAGVTSALRSFVQGMTTAVEVTGFLFDEVRALFGIIKDDDYVRLAERAAEIEKILENVRNPQSKNRLINELREIEEKMKKVHDLSGDVELAFGANNEKTQKRLEATNKLINESGAELLELQKQASGRDAEAARKEQEAFAKAIETTRDNMDPLRIETRELTEEYLVMKRALDQNKISAEEYTDFLDYALPEIEVKVKRTTVATDLLKKENEALAASAERGYERMRDAVGDYFEEMIVNGETSFDGLLDLFKNMIAEMIATAAANRIFIGLGIGGASSGANAGGDILSALTGGGGGGGIFGGISSAGGILKYIQNGFSSIGTSIGNGINYVADVYGQGGQMLGNLLMNSGNETLIGLGQNAWNTGNNAMNAGAMANAGMMLGNAAAGFVGNYAGQAVFDNDGSTGAGSAVGAAVGSYFLPYIGTAIGAFLGEGIEKLLGDIFGFGGKAGNNIGGIKFDYGTGKTRDFGVGNYDYENVERSQAVFDVFKPLVDLLGGSSLSGEIKASDRGWISYDGDKYGPGEGANSVDDLMDKLFSDIVMNATEATDSMKEFLLSLDHSTEHVLNVAGAVLTAFGPDGEVPDAFAKLVLQFNQNGQALIDFSASMASLFNAIEQNPVPRALEDLRTAQETAALSTTDVYNNQLSSITDMLVAYDGSLEATKQLSAAMAENQSMAYQMAMGLEAIRQAMSDMFGASAEAIRESVMTQEEIFALRQNEYNELLEAIPGIDDAEELAKALEEANRINTELFNMLEDPTDEQAEMYAQNAEELARISDERLDEMLARLEDSQQQQMANVGNMLELYAQKQEMTAEKFLEAVELFAASIQGNNGNSNNEVIV